MKKREQYNYFYVDAFTYQTMHDEALKEILTKFVTCSKRPLIPEGYSFMYELQQLKSAKEHFTMKVAPNHINYRWSPMSYRFEDYIEQFVRNRFPNADEEIADVRGDSRHLYISLLLCS